jgi:surface carbohydrate biosynthesis protein
MRKLEKIVKKKYDIVIIDHVGSEWLEYCIPEECTYFTIKNRSTIPYIKSFSFLYNLLRGGVKGNGSASITLLSAIILELNPKVVITFIDNNRFMGVLQTIFPEILFVSVQNGIRFNDPNFESRGNYFSFPHYFGFGDHEFDMMKSKNASVKKYYSKGSLKMGAFLSYLYTPLVENNNIKTICLISQYKGYCTNLSDLSIAKFVSTLEKICRFLSEFSQENNNIKITIAMRSEINSETYQDELIFYKDIFGNDAEYCANDRINMSSYQLGMDSKLIVGFHSALLFELFGAGKKLLFCGSAASELLGKWNDEGQYKFLPNEVLLNQWDYEEFKEKAYALLEMNDKGFLDKTKESKKHYMNFGDEYPHQIIHNTIQSKCRK